jgi:hypothetical protein
MRDSTSLLLLNHQLQKETQDLIQLLPTKSYVLDVIIAEEEKLWVTWLYAPVLSTRVDRVYTAIRTMGNYTKGHHLFERGDGGPPKIVWSLYSLIERGVRAGPVGRRTRKADKKISIKELVIDVRTPDVPHSEILPREIGTSLRRRRFYKEYGSDCVLNPDCVLDLVTSDIGILLRMCYHTASYGSLLYERIGSIKVLMDGKLHKEWDLAKCLAEVKFCDSFGHYPREQRAEVFAKWKLNAHQARIKFGLPVMPLKEKKTADEGSSSL